MLGIPVARLNTVVWMLAAALAFLALFLRSGITGVPLGYAEGLPTLLIALAALVIGRLERAAHIAIAAMALTLLEFGVHEQLRVHRCLAYPIMAAAMFVALLAQTPSSLSRRDNDATSSWRGAEEVRPLPRRSGHASWVPTLRYTLLALAVLGRGCCAVRAARRQRHQGHGAGRVRDHRDVAGGAHRLGGAGVARADGNRRHRRRGQRHRSRRGGTST